MVTVYANKILSGKLYYQEDEHKYIFNYLVE
jgi:hypothetical protein